MQVGRLTVKNKIMENQFTPKQLEQVQNAWKLFDEDESGNIDKDELKNVMIKLGLHATSEELNEIMADIDKDRDGSISYNDFCNQIKSKIQDALSEEELRETFKVMDTRNQSRFGEKELKEICSKLNYNLSPEEIKEMIAVADINGDGSIEFEEFVRVMLLEEN